MTWSGVNEASKVFISVKSLRTEMMRLLATRTPSSFSLKLQQNLFQKKKKVLQALAAFSLHTQGIAKNWNSQNLHSLVWSLKKKLQSSFFFWKAFRNLFYFQACLRQDVIYIYKVPSFLPRILSEIWIGWHFLNEIYWKWRHLNCLTVCSYK